MNYVDKLWDFNDSLKFEVIAVVIIISIISGFNQLKLFWWMAMFRSIVIWCGAVDNTITTKSGLYHLRKTNLTAGPDGIQHTTDYFSHLSFILSMMKSMFGLDAWTWHFSNVIQLLFFLITLMPHVKRVIQNATHHHGRCIIPSVWEKDKSFAILKSLTMIFWKHM